MKKLMTLLSAALLTLTVPAMASADEHGTGSTTVVYSGHGQTGGQLDEENCEESAEGTLHWVLTAAGASSAQISLDGGTTWHDMYRMGRGTGALHFESSWVGDLDTLVDQVQATYSGATTGNVVLTISHGCPGEVHES